MTNGLVRPLPPAAPNQAQSASQSSTPSTARKNCPSPKPEFDARKLRNGRSNFIFLTKGERIPFQNVFLQLHALVLVKTSYSKQNMEDYF